MLPCRDGPPRCREEKRVRSDIHPGFNEGEGNLNESVKTQGFLSPFEIFTIKKKQIEAINKHVKYVEILEAHLF